MKIFHHSKSLDQWELSNVVDQWEHSLDKSPFQLDTDATTVSTTAAGGATPPAASDADTYVACPLGYVTIPEGRLVHSGSEIAKYISYVIKTQLKAPKA